MANLVAIAGYASMDPQRLTVGTTAVAFPTPNQSRVKNPEKIQVQAASTNTVPILVGLSDVLADYSNGGIELLPGASTTLSAAKDELLFAIASAAAQKLLVTYFGDPS